MPAPSALTRRFPMGSTLKEAGEAIMKWFAGLSGQALDAAILKAFKQFDLDGTGLLDRFERCLPAYLPCALVNGA